MQAMLSMRLLPVLLLATAAGVWAAPTAPPPTGAPPPALRQRVCGLQHCCLPDLCGNYRQHESGPAEPLSPSRAAPLGPPARLRAVRTPPDARRHARPPRAPAGRPSIFPPRGLAPLMTPQFVVMTLEGAVTQGAFDLLAAVAANQSASGCPLHATYFAAANGSGACGMGAGEAHAR